jgi:hypothetical protein
LPVPVPPVIRLNGLPRGQLNRRVVKDLPDHRLWTALTDSCGFRQQPGWRISYAHLFIVPKNTSSDVRTHQWRELLLCTARTTSGCASCNRPGSAPSSADVIASLYILRQHPEACSVVATDGPGLRVQCQQLV